MPSKPPPPPPKGNRRNVKHGAHAKVPAKRVESKAVELAAKAPVRMPDGGLPVHDEEAILILANVLERLRDVDKFLKKYGAIDRKGKPRNAALLERRLQSHAMKIMKELGMTPQARAKLGLSLAKTVDLSLALSHPNPAKRQELLAEAGIVIDAEPIE